MRRSTDTAGIGRKVFYGFDPEPADRPAPARAGGSIHKDGPPGPARALQGGYPNAPSLDAGRGPVRGPVRGRVGYGLGRGPAAAPRVLLPVRVLPPQLLADVQPAMAGAAGRPIHAAARVHGVPAIPRAELVLLPVDLPQVLSREPLLAGSVLRPWHK